MKRCTRWILAAAAAALLPAGSCKGNLGEVSPGPVTFRVSVGPNGVEADGSSISPDVSSDGRYVVFASTAGNLAPPVSAFREIFLRDRTTGSLQNVTLLSARLTQSMLFGGTPITLSDCELPVVSDDGRFIAFLCKGELLTTMFGAFHTTKSLYLIDMEVLKVDPVGALVHMLPVWPDADVDHLSMSGDGSKIAFMSSATNFPGIATGNSQIYVVDNPGMTLTLISRQMGGTPTDPSNGFSFSPAISQDGQVVVFSSSATNLSADPTGGNRQIFLSASDGSGAVEIVSRGDGNPGAIADDACIEPAISADGRYVAFVYDGGGSLLGPPTGAPYIVRRDRTAFRTELVGSDALSILGVVAPPTRMSDDGRFVSYTGIEPPALALEDIFVALRDMQGGTFRPPAVLVGTVPIITGFPDALVTGDGRWFFWSSEGAQQVIGDTNNAYDVFGYGPLLH